MAIGLAGWPNTGGGVVVAVVTGEVEAEDAVASGDRGGSEAVADGSMETAR